MSKIKKYDEAVVKKFKEFVGTKEFKKLNKRFNPEKFAGTWKQTLSSPSTSFIGSGPNFSSVQATYTLKNSGLVGVKNEAYNIQLDKVSATGTSRARDDDIPMCRTVKFNNLFKIEHDQSNRINHCCHLVNFFIFCRRKIFRFCKKSR